MAQSGKDSQPATESPAKVGTAQTQDASEHLFLSHKRWAAVWKFLNSSFCLFICSSVLLGLLSFSYRQWVSDTERRERAEKLRLEISLRLSDMSDLAKGSDVSHYVTVESIQRISNGDTSKFYLRRPIFTEFEKESTTSLMWQLYLLTPNKERPTLKQSIKQSLEIDMQALMVRRRATALDLIPPLSREEKKAEAEGILSREFGQSELYRRVLALASSPMWSAW